MITEEDMLLLSQCRSAGDASDCANRHVGALVVWRGKKMGVGWNRNPVPHGDTCAHACSRAGIPMEGRTGDYDLCLYIHAEAAAILDAQGLTSLATLYCTDKPCPGCMKLIYGAGIVRLVWPDNELDLH